MRIFSSRSLRCVLIVVCYNYVFSSTFFLGMCVCELVCVCGLVGSLHAAQWGKDAKDASFPLQQQDASSCMLAMANGVF
jgi:hypothetical protein